MIDHSMPKATKTPKPAAGNGYCPTKIKPYNVSFDSSFSSRSSIHRSPTSRFIQRYNLFFILEREMILQQNNPTYDPFETLRAPDFVTGFEGIEMPSELPKRYSKLVLPPGWYLPGRNKKRSHKKSHGLLAFAGECRAPEKMRISKPHPVPICPI